MPSGILEVTFYLGKKVSETDKLFNNLFICRFIRNETYMPLKKLCS